MAQALAQPEAPIGKKWKKVPALTDEFDRWDGTKWRKVLWNYGVPVQMKSENSGVRDGNLWIKATLDEGAERWFETSRVMSRTKISYPMYTECSMRTAHISAYNTFWMNNGNSASRDEIDMCENNSKASITSQREERKYTMMSQYFVVVDNDTERNKGNFDNRNLSAGNPLKGIPWNEAYHTIGVWWKDANNIQFYLNGEPAGKVKSSRDFTRSLDIIWDLWTIDESWAGGIAVQSDLLDDSINTMYVDWIHTFTLEEDETLNIAKTSASEIKIFPNPTDDLITIMASEDIYQDAAVQIYDSLGTMVMEEVISQNNNQLSLAELSSGMYILKVKNNTSILSQTIVKQ